MNQLTDTYFQQFPKGIAHEDFSADNMLFHTDCISVIIDFDRNQYSYIWHDIGRIMLSLALRENQINREMLYAFLDGYAKHYPLTAHNIVDALKLTWCIETPWWIQPECFTENKSKIVRFKDKMIWLTNHWFELDALL